MNKNRKFKSRGSKLVGEILSLSHSSHRLVVRSRSDFRGKRTSYSVSIPQWKPVWWAWKHICSFHKYLQNKIYLLASVPSTKEAVSTSCSLCLLRTQWEENTTCKEENEVLAWAIRTEERRTSLSSHLCLSCATRKLGWGFPSELVPHNYISVLSCIVFFFFFSKWN